MCNKHLVGQTRTMKSRKHHFSSFLGKGNQSILLAVRNSLLIAIRFKARGIRGLYSGLGPTLFRAIPVNATKYFAFDLVLRIFQTM